jgi:hypothetical protein
VKDWGGPGIHEAPKEAKMVPHDFKGVRFVGGRNPYQAYVGDRIIGRYLTPEAAAAAYDVATFEAYGEDAEVNL